MNFSRIKQLELELIRLRRIREVCGNNIPTIYSDMMKRQDKKIEDLELQLKHERLNN